MILGFSKRILFHEHIEVKTNVDGSDLAALIAQLFQVLNTREDERLIALDESLNAFQYVNGKLFDENISGHLTASAQYFLIKKRDTGLKTRLQNKVSGEKGNRFLPCYQLIKK